MQDFIFKIRCTDRIYNKWSLVIFVWKLMLMNCGNIINFCSVVNKKLQFIPTWEFFGFAFTGVVVGAFLFNVNKQRKNFVPCCAVFHENKRIITAYYIYLFQWYKSITIILHMITQNKMLLKTNLQIQINKVMWLKHYSVVVFEQFQIF